MISPTDYRIYQTWYQQITQLILQHRLLSKVNNFSDPESRHFPFPNPVRVSMVFIRISYRIQLRLHENMFYELNDSQRIFNMYRYGETTGTDIVQLTYQIRLPDLGIEKYH
jgi:hypothetical protein